MSRRSALTGFREQSLTMTRPKPGAVEKASITGTGTTVDVYPDKLPGEIPARHGRRAEGRSASQRESLAR
jgi:hypothetical protein